MKALFRIANQKPLLLILGLAFLLRFVGIWYGLPSMYNSDEPDNVVQALSYGAKGSLEPTYFGYPTLYSYVLFLIYGLYFGLGQIFGMFDTALEFGAAYFLNPTGLFIVGRFLSVVLGTAGVYIIYKIGERFFSKRAAWMAALFVALSFAHVQASHWILLEAALVFMSALGIYLILRFSEAPTLRMNFLASFVCGLAISTKYNAGFVFVPLLLATVLNHKRELRHLFKHLGISIATVTFGFLLGTPYWLISFTSFFGEFKFLLSQVNYGMSGHFSSIPIFWPLWELIVEDWTVGFLLVAGFVYALFRRERKGLLLLSFIVPTFVLAGTWSRADLHYLLPVYPALAVLAALFLTDVLSQLPSKSLVACMTILLFIAPLGKSVYFDSRLAQEDTRAIAEEWIEQNIPENSSVAYENFVYGPNLFDPVRFFKNELESNLLPYELREMLLEERRKRVSYDLINFRKDFRPKASMNYDFSQEIMADPYVQKVLRYRLPTLETLRKAGAEYIMISSDNYDRYFASTPPAQNSAAWVSYHVGQTFYQNIFASKELVLLCEFKPTRWNLGPVVQIYKFYPITDESPPRENESK